MFSIDFIALHVLGYPISWLELIATVFGLASVCLAAKQHVLTWPTGILNEWGFFLLFFQVQLYADMLLQVVFFVITVYGWHNWRQKKATAKLHVVGWRRLGYLLLVNVVLTVLLGFLFKNIHNLLPVIFDQPAARPFIDTFVAITSIAAITLLARKAVEAWVLWIVVDVICIFLFYEQGIYLVAAEYCVFLVIASIGYISWRRSYEKEALPC